MNIFSKIYYRCFASNISLIENTKVELKEFPEDIKEAPLTNFENFYEYLQDISPRFYQRWFSSSSEDNLSKLLKDKLYKDEQFKKHNFDLLEIAVSNKENPKVIKILFDGLKSNNSLTHTQALNLVNASLEKNGIKYTCKLVETNELFITNKLFETLLKTSDKEFEGLFSSELDNKLTTLSGLVLKQAKIIAYRTDYYYHIEKYNKSAYLENCNIYLHKIKRIADQASKNLSQHINKDIENFEFIREAGLSQKDNINLCGFEPLDYTDADFFDKILSIKIDHNSDSYDTR
ncbi:MAG: hypothetical protein J0H68_07185 [Sphingobacteriia bacterium]|nr:hypothetical protein [Sphingobacteriia bacterium]